MRDGPYGGYRRYHPYRGLHRRQPRNSALTRALRYTAYTALVAALLLATATAGYALSQHI